MTAEAIGIAGTGRMGTAFARRLRELGHEVAVWNRTPERTGQACAAGAVALSDAGALARCGTILLSLSDGAAVASVLGDLARAGIRGRLVIDLSTLAPDEVVANGAQVAAAGGHYVECPVGGTVAPALKGQLLGFAGGDGADVARARPILEALCRRVEHLGPLGNGARMKLAVNLPLALYWVALGDALRLVSGHGIAAETIVSLIGESSGGPNVVRNRAQVVTDTLNGADQPGTFDIAGLLKDLDLARRVAVQEGGALRLGDAARAAYEAAIAGGLGRYDGASLARMIAEGAAARRAS